MQISIGPLYYFWTAQQTMDFYAALAEQPADRFFLQSRRYAMQALDFPCVPKADIKFAEHLAIQVNCTQAGGGRIL